MRNLLIYFIFSFIIIAGSSFIFSPQEDFDGKWQQVKQLEKQGLPRSAMELVDEIYLMAKADDNQSEILKALIYRVSLQSRFEEDHLLKAIDSFKEELAIAKSPEKQIVHSLLAELYSWYYQNNRWQINERGTVISYDNEDIKTWDALKINAVIRAHYMESLADRQLTEETKLIKFENILVNNSKESLLLWPTLYDLLANRALQYLSGYDVMFTGLSENINFHNVNYMSPADQFLGLEIPDSENRKEILILYQRLLKLHMENNNVEAYVDLDLRRLQYVYDNSNQTETDKEAYILALQGLSQKYEDSRLFAKISTVLAHRYVQAGSQYKASQSDEYRYELVKAIEICENVIARFPIGDEAAECRSMLANLKEKTYNFHLEAAVLPDKPFLGLVSFKNATSLHFKAVRIDKERFIESSRRLSIDTVKSLLRKTAVQTWKVDLPDTKDYQKHTTEHIFSELELGFYIIFASVDSNFRNEQKAVYQSVRVTNLGYFTNNDHNGGELEIFVRNRDTGLPVEDAVLTTFEYIYNPDSRRQELKKLSDFTSDENGFVKASSVVSGKQKQIAFSIQHGNDYIDSETNEYLRSSKANNALKTKTYLFTDRAIYRPGQTVYFKGLVVDNNKSEVFIKAGYNADVSLMDVNRKQLSSVEVETNEFGSYQGSFVIPTGGLNGRMTLKTKTGSARIQVEEYKRPTFLVTFDTITEKYKLGDEVGISGKAETFAGTPLTDATVKFRVVQTPMIIPYYRYHYPFPTIREITIAQGTINTNEDGSFRIEFPTLEPNNKNDRYFSGQHYTVYAEVIDFTGEVQSGSTNLMIGKQAVILEFTSKNVLLKEDKNVILFSSKNLSGADVEANVRLEVFKLTPPDQLLHARYWNKPDLELLSKSEFNESFPNLSYGDENDKDNWPKTEVYANDASVKGEVEVLAEFISDAKVGEYVLIARSISNEGDTTLAQQYLSLYSNESKRLPGKMIDWSVVNKTTAEPGDIIKLTIGSAAKKSKVYYEILNGADIVKTGWAEVSNSQKVIEIPIQESYRGGIEIRTVLMRFNRIYLNTHSIKVPFSNKKLTVKIETLRDYLTPGTKEEWKIKISGPDGEALATELLAGMYDASLDQFKANEWNLKLYHPKRTSKRLQSGFFHSSRSKNISRQPSDYQTYLQVQYPQINWFNYQHYGPGRGGSDMLKSGAYADGLNVEKGRNTQSELEDATEILTNQEVITEEVEPSATEEKEEQNTHIRTNFNETAFFYPQLKTDSSGSVIFSFNTPDALTEWKIMLLAHSQDLKTGSLIESIKAKKELMIIPNLPRFVRQGDILSFSAKLINFSEQAIDVESSIEFFNAITLEPVQIFLEDQEELKSQSLQAGENTLLQWKIEIPFDLSMLGYRITAISESFADAEERLIPVLTNRMLVTETLPIHTKGNETKTYTFDKLLSLKDEKSSTLNNHRLTLEFASNPAWYAVQALPYLSEPKTENAGSTFYRLYANLLSQYIIDQNPKIRNVFESWKSISPEAFYSQLMKNEELKNVVLNATPWVLEAEDESEQKRRVALLFDVNRMANDKIAAIEKLKKSQLPGGGWSWFKGMKEDRHITQQIVLGFARLLDKQVISFNEDPDIKRMLARATKYLDARVQEDYEKHKKNNKSSLNDDHLSSRNIEYLYGRTLLLEDFPIPQKSDESFNYYAGQAKKYWLKKNNYLQSMIALTMHNLGNRNEAEGIMRSLKERALLNDELGMYWRQERGWYWYQAPIENQAMAIEVFSTIGNDPKSVEQMKVWLLKQKQTTRWPTTTATAEAVYALLFSGDDLLVEDKLVNIKVGTQQLNPRKVEGMKIEPGTGYFKTSWNGSEIQPEMGEITIQNPNSHIAWGGAYWQYFEDMDKITVAGSPLNISKKVFIELMTDDGPVIKPLAENQSLKIGDKVIIQLVIVTDRNMDYIHMKDMRATALEPIESISGYSYGGGLWFYKNITDVSTEFFIRSMQKGTYVIEYPMKVTQKGSFSNGIATIQSYYAPEFASHSAGMRLFVK